MSGRRLMLRLTTRCNSGCAHCTIADIAHHPDKTLQDATDELIRGREGGCTELVIMRGEATLQTKVLLQLTRRARKLGYVHVQLQTNARMLSYGELVDRLIHAGMSFFEVSIFGHDRDLHDAVDGTEGAFDQAIAGLKHLVERDAPLMVTVPVVKRNVLRLPEIAEMLAGLGVRRIQYNFSRPVKVGPEWQTKVLVRLDEASPMIREGMRRARALGMIAETEAVPLCHLDPDDAGGADVHEDFSRHAVSDVHRRADSLKDHRQSQRPVAEPCEACNAKEHCPRTWAAYQMLFGTWELRPLRRRA